MISSVLQNGLRGSEVEVSYYIMDGSISNYPRAVHKEKSDLLPENGLKGMGNQLCVRLSSPRLLLGRS